MIIFGVKISNKIVYTLLSIIICYILIVIDNVVFNKIIKKNNTNGSKHVKRSQNTILTLLKNIIKYVILIVTITTVLKIYGIDTTALITGIGALSVVVGLALQDVLKDYLVGLTIIAESQFAIGELVEINGFKGEVISLGLKTTRLKALSGEIKIISNRNISEVINYSLNKTLLTINVNVSYEDDNEKVEEILENFVKELPNLVPEIDDEVVLDGLDSLSDSSVVYRISTYVRDREKFIIKRKINKYLKKTLDDNKIKIPYPQVEVHNEK